MGHADEAVVANRDNSRRSRACRPRGCLPILLPRFSHFVMQSSKRCGRDFSVDDYEDIAAHHYLGEWIFAGPPFNVLSWENDSYPVHLQASGAPPQLIAAARECRQWAPSFLDACANSVLKLRPTAIGFTTTFGQTIAALGVAMRIKARSPAVSIVFGGANCEGSMGQALMQEFSCIDVVVQGEGDNSAVGVFSDLLAGRPVKSSPGILSRPTPGAKSKHDDLHPVRMDEPNAGL